MSHDASDQVDEVRVVILHGAKLVRISENDSSPMSEIIGRSLVQRSGVTQNALNSSIHNGPSYYSWYVKYSRGIQTPTPTSAFQLLPAMFIINENPVPIRNHMPGQAKEIAEIIAKSLKKSKNSTQKWLRNSRRDNLLKPKSLTHSFDELSN
jgi:hypothetical protein